MHGRIGVAAIAAVLGLHGGAWAAQYEVYDCGALIGMPVETEVDENAQAVAAARAGEAGRFVIQVNPFFGNLGTDTVRWLYLRQCALIGRLGPDVRRVLTDDDHRYADCEAIALMGQGGKLGRFGLQTIQQDIAAVSLPELGERKDVDVRSCR